MPSGMSNLNFRGARPLCARCEKREAESYSEGVLCQSCRGLMAMRKKRAVEAVGAALAIAERLYRQDKPRYKPLFGWINKTVQRATAGRPYLPALISQTLKRLEEKEASGRTALAVVEYCGGTLRKLEQERDAKRLREGRQIDAPKTMDVLAELLKRQGYKVEKR